MTAAERKRLYRQRQRVGLVVLDVEIHADRTADLMMMAGYLDPNLADDRDALRRAVEAYLAEHAEPPDHERDASLRCLLKNAILKP